LLVASGGKLELSKCFYYLIKWTFNEHGDAILGPDPIHPIDIIDHTTGKTAVIKQLKCKKPHRTLGAFIAPSGTSTMAFENLKKKTTELSRHVSASAISREQGHRVTNQYYATSARYGMCATVFSAKQIAKIEGPVVDALLPAMGFNRHSACAVRYGPKDLGGIGFPSLSTMHGMEKLKHLVQQLRLWRPLGQMMMISLHWMQLHTGRSTPLLEETRILPYIDEPWFECVHKFLVKNEAKVVINEIPIQPLQHAGDKHIMDVVMSRRWKKRDIKNINNCRLFLRITTLSEICRSDGKAIFQECYNCESTPSCSNFWWPVQARPGKAAITSWKTFLSTLCKYNSLTLLEPLGPWTNINHRMWKWYYCDINKTVYRDEDTEWHTFNVNQRDRRSWTIHPEHEVTTTLPTVTAMQPLTQLGELRFHIPAGFSTIPQQPNIILHPWKDFIATLPEWEQDLLQLSCDGNLDEAITKLSEALQSNNYLYFVSDGGADFPVRGSFGFVLATSNDVLWQGRGYVRGRPIDSHRSEGYGRMAKLLLTTRFCQFAAITHSPAKILPFCDNKSIVSKSDPDWDPYYKPSTTTDADWDVIAQIHELQDELQVVCPGIRPCQHVKGHQDDNKDYDELPWEAKLNVMADRQATLALQTLRELPDDETWHPLPACSAYLCIADEVTTGKSIDALSYRISEMPLHDYLKERHNWTEDTLRDIDWDSFKLARKGLPTNISTFVTKISTKHLPTAYQQNKIGKGTDQCFYCQQPETQAHMFRCKHHDRETWRRQFIANLSKHLQKTTTGPNTTEAIKNGINDWLFDEKSGKAQHNQVLIGWEQFMYGYIDSAWYYQQDTFYRNTDPTNKQLTASNWSKKLIQFLWYQCHALWKIRNDEKYRSDNAAAAQHAASENELKVQEIYRQAPELSATDRAALLGRPMETILQKRPVDLRHWIQKTSDRLRKSIREQQARIKKGHRDIRNFFQATSTNQDSDDDDSRPITRSKQQAKPQQRRLQATDIRSFTRPSTNTTTNDATDTDNNNNTSTGSALDIHIHTQTSTLATNLGSIRDVPPTSL